MIPVVRAKDESVTITPSPAGFHILWAVRLSALVLGHDIIITAGSNGKHSGPEDPHYLGNAFDLHTHGLDKELMLSTIMANLGKEKFYGFIEDETEENEHIHVQLRHGIMYP